MTKRGIRPFVARAVHEGRVAFSYHAIAESMPERDLTRQDVLSALAHATSAEAQDEVGTKWKLFGPILNGDEYAVVIRVRGDRIIVVVTAHLPP